MDTSRQDQIIAATWEFDGAVDVGEYLKLLVI